MQTKSDISRNQILDKITKAKAKRGNLNLVEPNWENNIYKEIENSLEDCFAKELSAVNGLCIICQSEEDSLSQLKDLIGQNGITRLFCRDKQLSAILAKNGIPFLSEEKDFSEMEAGITFCETLVARTGSVVVSSAQESGRQLNIYPPIHIVLAKKSQLVPYISDAITFMKQKYGEDLPSAITNITGPSRTADIEKTLILGAHGPKQIWVLLNCAE